jgi:hypothetical protein
MVCLIYQTRKGKDIGDMVNELVKKEVELIEELIGPPVT